MWFFILDVLIAGLGLLMGVAGSDIHLTGAVVRRLPAGRGRGVLRPNPARIRLLREPPWKEVGQYVPEAIPVLGAAGHVGSLC